MLRETSNPFEEIFKRLDAIERRIESRVTGKKYMTLIEASDYLNLSKYTIYCKIASMPHF
jgi:hypothetical protein